MQTEERKIKLRELVDQFKLNIKQYKSSSYDEANTRVDFIDKFFELLDWDVRNTQGFSEDYREVVREDKIPPTPFIKGGVRGIGKPKAPDYSFRIGGVRKFFVEAKKPSVNIKEDIIPAYQVRRYAYTAKLPLSVLTDFEEFSVYDTRIKPAQKDNAGTARIFYCTYTEYINNLDFIYNTLSKTAILKGSFDRYVVENKNKKGTSEVDKEFLKMIEGWRNDLARNIAVRNKELSVYNLNYAVQKIIDRLIFLRIAEDRHMEDYGALSSACNESNVYLKLDEIFKRSDNKYNSGLFHIEDWISDLQIDDKIITPIIKGLYYPDCPYEFSVLPIEILGHIYEQFLGKTIRLTASHQAKVEEKPEVRKAGGVYYTPQYIVDYIVENTVGEKVKGKKPEDIANLKILDPACGSGSFLVGAYNYLINYHLEYYLKEKNRRKSLKEGKIYQVTENTFRLSTEEKRRVLLNNIYGVDIDYQAVEVTKLSLLLKLMEGEYVESSGQLFKHSDLKLLPDLSDNIKCGNSLIGSDFYDDKNLDLFGKEDIRKVNAFDWEEEFLTSPPAPLQIGEGSSERGILMFVIGNPPYVLGRETFDENIKQYLSSFYYSYKGKFDLYIYFSEKAITLLKKSGLFGYILPNTILVNENAINIRKFILDNCIIKTVRVFDAKVFEKAQVESVILILKNEKKSDALVLIESLKESYVSQSVFLKSNDFRFNIFTDNDSEELINRILNISIPLGKLTDSCIGIQLGGSSGENKKDSFLSIEKKDNTFKEVLDGKNIGYYLKEWDGIYVKYGSWLHRKRDEKYFINPKIVIRQIGKTPISTYDDENYYTLNTIYNLINSSDYSLKYFLGIINSRFGKWFWVKKNSDFKTLFPKIKKSQIENIPIRKINFSNSSERDQYDKIVSFVEQMLSSQKGLHNAKIESDKKVFQQKVDLLDRQIDNLVYELYGLSEEEIGVVEG